jgi:hypothetical protein
MAHDRVSWLKQGLWERRACCWRFIFLGGRGELLLTKEWGVDERAMQFVF